MRISHPGESFRELARQGAEQEVSPERLKELKEILERDMAEITATFRKSKSLTPELAQSDDAILLREDWEILSEAGEKFLSRIPQIMDPEKKKIARERFEKIVGDSGLKM
jgi:hypothetical protein